MDVKTSLVLSAALVLLVVVQTTKADEALMKRVCDATPDPAGCTSCLNSSPTSSSSDKIGLTVITLGCAADDMSVLYRDTLRFLQSSSEPMNSTLATCLGRFEDGQNMIVGVAGQIKDRQFTPAKGVIQFQILNPLNSCTSLLHSKSLQVPSVVSKGISVVAGAWNIVLGILATLK